MKASIKIIKRKQNGGSNEVKPSEIQKPVERSTREIATTVKSWIVELQQRKRAQVHSFSELPVNYSGGVNG